MITHPVPNRDCVSEEPSVFERLLKAFNDSNYGLRQKGHIPLARAAVFVGNELQLKSINGRGLSPDPHSPSPPQTLWALENLFYNVNLYFQDSCRRMNLDHRGNLLTPNGAKLDNALLTNFDSYCFTATMLLEKGLYVGFRLALSKASALVEQILLDEHPRTLACFLEVFIHLIQTGCHEVVITLCDYIKRISVQVSRERRPWGQICQLLGDLDTELLDQAMAQVWKCTIDTFDNELGTLSRLAISVRLDYIKRVVTNQYDEERFLRELLARFRDNPNVSTPRVMLNLAHNLNRQGRYNEAEKMALEVLWMLQGYAQSHVERIEALKVISRSQFHRGDTHAAEETIRKAIQLIRQLLGLQHSWVPEFMNVLEGWLRIWGREDDADKIRKEIEQLMGEDDIVEMALEEA